jgi:hypothetical protein
MTKRIETILNDEGILKIDGKFQLLLRCKSGRVWATREGGQERVLGSGDVSRFRGAGRLLVQGLAKSRVEVRWA